MASKNLIDIALKLSKELGANTNKFLGSRTNISFLGKGPKDYLLFQSDLNVEALPAFQLNKLMPQIESSMGYLTGGKLNDIQKGKLYENMLKIDEVFNPKVTANITDLASGTRNLDAEGLGSLRTTQVIEKNKPAFDKAMQSAAKESEAMRKAGLDPSNLNDFNKAEEMGIIRSSGKIEEDLKAMAERLGLNDPNKNKFLQTTDETIVN